MSLIKGIWSRLKSDPELGSLALRLLGLLLALLYFEMGVHLGRLSSETTVLALPASTYLLASLVGFLLHRLRPAWTLLPYLLLGLDILAIGVIIYLSGEGTGPLYLLYLWVLISAGVCYGRQHLMLTAIGAFLSYSTALIALGDWREDALNASFCILMLIALPLYLDRLLRRLHRAKQTAERASQAKSEFLANMTHDLQTPLAGLLGMNELLRGTRLDREQREYLEAMDKSARVLLALISDILDQCRLEVGKIQLNEGPSDPRDSLREVCNAMRPYALRKQIELHCEPDSALPPRLIVDALRLRQILFNLVANAVKFTDAGEVRVQMRIAEDALPANAERLCLEVSDTGPGIAESDLPHLFESFRQLGAAARGKRQGAGLGTSIARDLTVLMGGRIEVESRLGVGSRFRVWLPLHRAELDRDLAGQPLSQSEAPEPQGLIAGHHSPDTEDRLDAALLQAQTAPIPEDNQPVASALMRGRVLVAEDNRIAAKVVSKLLEQCGCEVRLVENGAQALEQALTGKFDLALVDLRMPVLDGFEFARQLRRAEGQGQHLTLVALTADANDLEQACLEAGMDDFLTKPVTGKRLADLLARWCPRDGVDSDPVSPAE